ncbi:MAG: ATP-binding protein [Candidatus Paceibacterota bacterium]
MNYKIVLLFIMAVLNGFFSYFILGKGKSKTNVLFSLITLAVASWALFLGFFISTKNLGYALLYADIYYIFAAIIPTLFFLFTIFFNSEQKFKKIHFVSLIPIIAIIGAFIYDKNFLLKDVFFLEDGTKGVILNKEVYIGYGVYFLFFVFLAYYNLIDSYKKVKDELVKLQFKFIFWGTTISYILGMIFNLFLPWRDYSLIWLGPPFTLILVGSLGYAIIKHHLFNVKVIATEVLTFALWVFILLRTILANNLEDQLVNGGILIVVIVAGILLIRSVIKEVETNEQLKELDRQKSEFLSIASHQFRSPLSAIKGYASLIMEGSYGKIEDKIKQPVKNMFDSTNNLAMIVEDFLNVSRIEQGRMEYKFENVKVNELIEKVIEEMGPSISDSGLEFSFTYDKNGQFEANVDVSKFRQVITNLIDNALKYTKYGWVKAELKKDGGKILFKLSDSGVGIPEKELSGLFTLFRRANNANKANVKGTGLGLYIVKKIMEAHNGRVWAESDGEGKGAEFYVELNTNVLEKHLN